MEADYKDETIQSFAQNLLRLGKECRDLNVENQRLKYEAVHDASQLGEQGAEIASLKAEVERLTADNEQLQNRCDFLEGKQ